MMRIGCLVGAVLVVGVATPASAQAPATTPLLERVAAYVQQFVDNFSNVVSEEVYLQQFREAVGRRELRSDFLLVAYPGEQKLLLTFRDVLAVDRRPIADQQARITRLFLEPFASAVKRAAEIQRDGERHTIARGRLADPLGVLSFLQGPYQENFTFVVAGRDDRYGTGVVLLEGSQRAPPDGRPTAQRLKAWVEEATGRIVRTELVTGRGSTAAITTTTFGTDPALRIAVPVEMRDQVPVGVKDEFIGVARYGNFRRFTVNAEQEIELPDDSR